MTQLADAATLARKLLIKSGQRIIVRHCPDEFVEVFKNLGAAFDRGTIAEITLSFVHAQSDVDNACKEAIALTAPGGMLWMAYPQKGETITWESFMGAGWQPESQINMGAVWSALRFRPKEDSKAR